MVHPWKCMLYFTPVRAISWTNCEKGSFQIRNSVLFWNWQISQRATVPGQYFWVFLTLPAFKNSFWGAFPPMVGHSFFLASSSPPNIDAPASAAIWANCWVTYDLPTSPNCSAFSTCFFISSGTGGVSCTGDGRCTGEGGPLAAVWTWALILTFLFITSTPFLPSSLQGMTLVLAILECRQEESTNRKAVWF